MNRFRLAAAALAFVASSAAWADLRVFDVGTQHQQEIYSALRSVLNDNPQTLPPGNGTYGRVERLADGQILVNAQAPTLAQVEQIINAIRARPVDAAPRVTLRYWAVLGARGAGNAANAIGTAPPAALDDVLTELKRFHDDVVFRVIGNATVTTDSGQNGEVDGSVLKVAQLARVQGDNLNGDLRIALRGGPPNASLGERANVGELELRTTLKRGEFVVLGESQLQSPGLDGPVFYVVHWAAN